MPPKQETCNGGTCKPPACQGGTCSASSAQCTQPKKPKK